MLPTSRTGCLRPLHLLAAACIVTSTPLAAQTLIATDRSGGDAFGTALSLSNSTGLIGTPWDNIDGADSGSAYLFRNLDTATGTVTQSAKLLGSDRGSSDAFGYAVSLSGITGLIGAPNQSFKGSAYVFRNLDTATGTVTQNAKLLASDGLASDSFGVAVSLSGSTGLIGADGDDDNGSSSGSAYVFRGLSTAFGTLTQNAKLLASDGAANDFFGDAVSLSGSTGLIGANGDDDNGSSSGSAYVFRNLDTATGTVTQNAKLLASDGAADDFFGDVVSLSGSTGLIGANGDDDNGSSSGSAYVFRNLDTATGTVTQNAKLLAFDGAANDAFGVAVSLSGSTGLIGASGDDDMGSASGSAYVFRNLDTATGTVTESVKLTASDGAANDGFGSAVNLDGDGFIIGAPGADGDTGKAYVGTVTSFTTLDAGNTSRAISGLSFTSQSDWIVGDTTDSNQVTLGASDSGTVTASGKAVYIGKNSGSDNNTLIIAGTLAANTVYIGASGNTGNTLQIGTGGTTGSVAAPIENHGALVFNRSDDVAFSNAISGSGSLTKSGAGTLTLSGSNTSTGAIALNAGTLAIDSAGALGSGAIALNGGALAVSGGSAVTIPNAVSVNAAWTYGSSAALTVSGPVTLNGFNALSTSATVTLSGGIGESTPSILIKQGSGELELTGAGTYTGGTFIQSGTMRINNSSGSAFGTGAVTVASGATLTGEGSFTGALQLNGTYSPGNSPGTQFTGSQTWAGGANLIWEINNADGTAGTNWDLLSLSGALTITASSANPFTINLTSLTLANIAGQAANFDPASNYTFNFVTAAGGIEGFDTSDFTLDTSGFTNPFTGSWSLSASAGALSLNYTAVPEPGTYAAIFGVIALAGAAYRRYLAKGPWRES